MRAQLPHRTSTPTTRWPAALRPPGTVLLANDGLLPLPTEGTLAVIGAFAVDARYQGAGSSKVDADPDRRPARRAHRADGRAGPTIRYAAGYDPITGETTPALMAEAAAVARSADRVVLVVGLPDRLETEARDRAEWAHARGDGPAGRGRPRRQPADRRGAGQRWRRRRAVG